MEVRSCGGGSSNSSSSSSISGISSSSSNSSSYVSQSVGLSVGQLCVRHYHYDVFPAYICTVRVLSCGTCFGLGTEDITQMERDFAKMLSIIGT
jgi:hypothetical protein